MDYEIMELIDGWKQRVNDHQKANYALAIKHDKYHYWIGISAIIFAAIAGGTLLTETVEPQSRTSIGIIAIIGAILCAIQTFYSFAKRAENNRLGASQLIHVRRDIEIFEKFVPTRKSEREQRTREIEERISKIEKQDAQEDVKAGMRRGLWILLSSLGALVLLLLVIFGNKWLANIPMFQQSEVNAVKESVQQGLESWKFDSRDPLVGQRIILINTLINEIAAQKVVTLLTYMNERDSETPISLYLSSTGGYTKDAYAIAHAIQESESPVNTLALGDCFSACAKILMSGTGIRSIAPYSRVMIHTNSYPYDDDPHSNSNVLYEREWEFVRKYSDFPLDWINREENYYYLTPEEAIDYQIADEILR